MSRVRIRYSDVQKRYSLNALSDTDVVITPEAAKLLCGLIRFTPQKAADSAGIKKNRLEKYEEGTQVLSSRDKRWLQSMFECAGAEFFMGQGKLHVHLNGKPVITFGERAEGLKNLPVGPKATEERFSREGIRPGTYYPSKGDIARFMGVSRPRISAIEHPISSKFYLADLVDLKKAFDQMPINPDNVEWIAERKSWGYRFGGGSFGYAYS